MQPLNTTLWHSNTPSNFWQPRIDLGQDLWRQACSNALNILGLPNADYDIETLLALTLGEQRFGTNHWQMSFPKQVYYIAKPALPRVFTKNLRRFFAKVGGPTDQHWPIEDRYARFLWEVMRQVLLLSGKEALEIRNFWPGTNKFAFVITHDVETGLGQRFVRAVADLDESLGYRSSFNFVPERYKVDFQLLNELRRRGFEIGVHGLRHDGRLFASQKTFAESAQRINQYLHEWQSIGFRCELTLRQPEWMQWLDIEYDLSFFDTDPFEPIPGGTMSIWPFTLGRFLELPYTLAQDYTLTAVINECTPRIWLQKVDFIQKYHGMALVNTHPDYLAQKTNWKVYKDFLVAMRDSYDYWQPLPCTVADWWHRRSCCEEQFLCDGRWATARLCNQQLQIDK